MNYSQLNQRFCEITRDAIADLSDLEVIMYSSGHLCAAFFPENEKAIFHAHFSDVFWTNQAYQEYWRTHYGRGYRLNLADSMTAQLREVSYNLDGGYSDEFTRLIENDAWVQTNASLIRKDLLSDLPTKIEIIVEEMIEHDTREIYDLF